MRIHLAVIWVPAALLLIVGTVLLVRGEAPVLAIGSIGLGAVFLIASVTAILRRGARDSGEPGTIEALDEARRRELIRGTSMHLRDMKYRYSVRVDRTGRTPFTREVNTITLGFVPVIITDNRTDRQGYGYVAFPFDGERWRGPGLPCGGDPDEAVAHAARCVSPLDQETEKDSN